MSAARVNVVHMSKMIQIRNVPDEMHRALKATRGRGRHVAVRLHQAGARRRRRRPASTRSKRRIKAQGRTSKVDRPAGRSSRSSAKAAATDDGPRRLGPGRVSRRRRARARRSRSDLDSQTTLALGADLDRCRGRSRAAAQPCAGASSAPRRPRRRSGDLMDMRLERVSHALLVRARLGAARQRQLLRRPLRRPGRGARRAAAHLRRPAGAIGRSVCAEIEVACVALQA